MQNTSDNPALKAIIGECEFIKEVRSCISKIADANVTVLILGASGTGKELVANAIHKCSKRSSFPFLAVNCGGLSETLLESTLFGHERGAFTGAVKQHKGYLESATGGTIFLDEIGDLPLNAQATLLRAIQEKQITRIGSTNTVPVDIRILAATNKNLEQLVTDRQFRDDLFYRVNVSRIHMPTLEERGDDKRILIEHFLAQECKEKSKACGISDEAMKLFLQYRWPGNVRELQSAIERSVAWATGETIGVNDIPSYIVRGNDKMSPQPSVFGKPVILKYCEEMTKRKDELIEAAMTKEGKNKSKAAKLLGINRQKLDRLLRKNKF